MAAFLLYFTTYRRLRLVGYPCSLTAEMSIRYAVQCTVSLHCYIHIQRKNRADSDLEVKLQFDIHFTVLMLQYLD